MQSHRDSLRGMLERAEGDIDNAIVLAADWWAENLLTQGEPFLDSLGRELGVRAVPSQEIQEAVDDAFYAAGRKEEGFEARLRERLDSRENPDFTKRVDAELVRPYRRAIVRVLVEEADRYWAARDTDPP